MQVWVGLSWLLFKCSPSFDEIISPLFLFSLFYCRSVDYGATYEKLNDKVGLKTVLSYLYVNPTNKRKVREEVRDSCVSLLGSRVAWGHELRTNTRAIIAFVEGLLYVLETNPIGSLWL